MRNQQLQSNKEAAIKSDYAKMVAERKYVKEYITDQLGMKYYLSPRTIERIVWGEYEANRARKAERDRLLGVTA